MTCSFCRGSGQHLCYQNGSREFYICQGCGGAGVRVMYGPPEVQIHPWREKFRKNAERMMKANAPSP